MTAPLWTPHDLIAASGGRLIGEMSPGSGVSIDTRTLEAGDLFFAIKGDVHDGHGFVRQALAKGAAVAVVAEERAPEFEGAGPLLLVPDVLAAMAALVIAARTRSAFPTIASRCVTSSSTSARMRISLSE